jgi:hypothetical protein
MHVARTGQERNAYKFCCKRERNTMHGDKSRNGGVILKRPCGHADVDSSGSGSSGELLCIR